MAIKGISSLIDLDMIDDSQFQNENTIESIETNEVTTGASKKKGGRPRGSKNRVTKPKTTSKKSQGTTRSSQSTAQPKVARKRKVLEEKPNDENVSHNIPNENADTLEAENTIHRPEESEDELDSPKTVSLVSQSKDTAPVNKKKTATAHRKRKVVTEDVEIFDSPIARQGSAQDNGIEVRAAPVLSRPAPKRTKLNAGLSREKSNPTMNEAEGGSRGSETTEDQFCRQPPPSSRSKLDGVPRAVPKSRLDAPIRRRGGSVSDTERAVGDPNLRRKLGDITRKFENMDSKYRSLKESGVVEANTNVERLRKQCEATTHGKVNHGSNPPQLIMLASNELVAALKKELATQTSLAQDSRKHQRALQASEAELTNLRSNVAELSNNLSVTQNEIRSLQAKLAASRSASAHAESVPSKTPASAMKHQAQPKAITAGSAELAQAAQVAQLKEDLYSDLTGLIIRGVKKVDEGDLYDCIQTGRNGSKCSTLSLF